MSESTAAVVSTGKHDVRSLDTAIKTGLLHVVNRVKILRSQKTALLLLCGLSILIVLILSLRSVDQREIYSNLQDQDRATITQILDKEQITYDIDTKTGRLSVNEEDYYRARMVIASAGALAPQSGTDLLTGIPLGTSRLLESEYIRTALEHELSQSILQITVVEAARVHLAMPKTTAFVSDKDPAGASVMIKTKDGQTLSSQQVEGITNLIAGSIPTLVKDRVKVIDHAGNLLTQERNKLNASVQAQQVLEDKIKDQITRILLPIFGSDGFQVEVQVALDPTLSTSATESYANEGSLRRELLSEELERGRLPYPGIPGVVTNTQQDSISESPNFSASIDPEAANSGSRTSTREFDLDRTISVRTNDFGVIQRISVGVVFDAAASNGTGSLNLADIRKLVSAVAGLKLERGDEVVVLEKKFKGVEALVAESNEKSFLRNYIVHISIFLISSLILVSIFIYILLKKKETPNLRNKEAGLTSTPAVEEQTVYHNGTAAKGASKLEAHKDQLISIAMERPEKVANVLRKVIVDGTGSR